MRVLVTGGTGFVGAHTVKAVLDAGHQVVLLVRDPARIEANLGPLGVGIDRVEHVVGDMTDASAVARAIDGCDAVIHAAAVVSLDKSRAEEILAANVTGAATVIDAAVERRLDPIVYVSSASALFTPGVDLLHADLPPADVDNAYGRSKAAAEAHVRAHQAAGAPVAITYPGGVAGPPAGSAAGEIADAFATLLDMGWVPGADGAWSVVDVRDVADVHVALLVRGQGPRRFICGGHFMTLGEVAALLAELTGRRFPVLPVPGAALRGLARLLDVVRGVVPFETVFTEEAMELLTRWAPTDDDPVATELGIMWRPVEDTFAAAIDGLVAANRISKRRAGR